VTAAEKNKIKKIHILTTGGTIDKSYDEIDGVLDNRESIIRKQVISRLRLPYLELEFHSVLAKDSLHMQDEDRQLIVDVINRISEHNECIVVLHGTDTMAQTAELALSCLPKVSVPVLFTGAMRPMGFINSDALQNITEAIFASQIVKPGFYVCFHGQLFNVPHVRKNRRRATFEAT
jgi:L-asparaginase